MERRSQSVLDLGEPNALVCGPRAGLLGQPGSLTAEVRELHHGQAPLEYSEAYAKRVLSPDNMC